MKAQQIEYMLIVLAFLGSVGVGAEPRAFKWGADGSVVPEELKVRCTISLPKGNEVAQGERLPIEFHFDVTDTRFLYNIAFDGRIPPAATLAVFDSDKEYRGNLFAAISILRRERRPNELDWTYVRAPGFVGITRYHTLMHPEWERNPNWKGSPILPPGKYHIQLIFSDRMLYGRPVDLPADGWKAWLDKWQAEEVNWDYGRSNIETITVKPGQEGGGNTNPLHIIEGNKD